jgi:non-specific serine/threonine protein kinase
MLRALSVFAGGFTLESVVAVCGAGGDRGDEFRVLDLLTHLVDKSLVTVDEGGARRGEAPRYRLLETVRQYARERLQEEGAERVGAVRGRHLDWFLALAEQAEPQLVGPSQATWLARLESEHENLLAALEWWNDRAPGAEDYRGVRLAGSMGRFWSMRGYLRLGRAQLQRTLDASGGRCSGAILAKAQNAAGILGYFQGDLDAARASWSRALEIQRGLGDRRAVAGVLNNLGLVAEQQGRYDEARALFGEALIVNRESSNRAWEAINLNNLGNVDWSVGNLDAARRYYEDALVINRAVGNRAEEARNLSNLGAVAEGQGRFAEARTFHEQSLPLKRELADKRGLAMSLGNLSVVLAALGDLAGAIRAQREALSLRIELSDRYGLALSLSEASQLALANNEPRCAARLAGGSAGVRQRIGSHLPRVERDRDARVAEQTRLSLGEPEYSRALHEGLASGMDAVAAEALDWLQSRIPSNPMQP